MPLQAPTGPHAVSTLTLELPARGDVTIEPDRWRFNPSSPAFKLKTVLFTIFYPTDAPGAGAHAGNETYKSNTVAWLSGSKWKSIQGLLKYAGINRFAAIPAVLPAYQVLLAKLPYVQNAPLLGSNADAASPARLPTAVFSHGLGGTSTTYSTYLSSLASHGMVAVAIEHRDGTCPHTTINTRDEQGTAREESLMYVKEDEVKVGSGDDASSSSSSSKWSFRRAQIELRRAEIETVLQCIDDINAGNGDKLIQASTRPIVDPVPDLSAWKGRLNESLSAIGHSFGGATMLSLLASSSNRHRFTSSVLLDPWLEPLPESIDSAGITTPTLIINSQGFTVWRSHFDRLRGIAQGMRKNQQNGSVPASSSAATATTQLYTLTGTKHTDFSDFPFLIPRLFASSVDPTRATKTFAHFTELFVTGDAHTQLDDLTQRPERPHEVESKDMGEAGVLVEHQLQREERL